MTEQFELELGPGVRIVWTVGDTATERFELLEQLGQGGMGVVWKALDIETRRIVGLKLLHPSHQDDDEMLQQLVREAETGRQVNSLNAVQILGYGKQDGVAYLAMEWVPGTSLRERLRESGPVNWDEGKRILLHLATALVAAHSVGIAHGDFKASKVLLRPDGAVKLVGFAIARPIRDPDFETLVDPGSPEQPAPALGPDVQDDLRALGRVLCEAMTGMSPPADGSFQTIDLDQADAAFGLNSLPEEARSVVERLLESEPRRRIADAATLLVELGGLSVGRTGVDSIAPDGEPSKRRWWQRLTRTNRNE